MKTNIKLLVVIIFSFTLHSCTEEIELDLNSSDPQIVVEGKIALGETAKIKLSESINFDDDNEFPKIENAIVTISDDFGNSEILVETSAGIYEGTSILGKIGQVYNLKIETDNKVLTSYSEIQKKVKFDSLIVTKSTSTGGPGGGGKSGYEITVNFKDSANFENYYRFVAFVNGNEIGDIFVYDDRLIDGTSVQRTLQRFSEKLNMGDTLEIEMQCIDKNVYDYFDSFGNLLGGPQNSSTPANPYTNVIGTELGYFSAHTTERIKVVIE